MSPVKKMLICRYFEYMSCPSNVDSSILNEPEAESSKEQTGPFPLFKDSIERSFHENQRRATMVS